MKTTALFVAALSLCVGCQKTDLRDLLQYVDDPNDVVVQVARQVATQIMVTEQPAFNDAVQDMPYEAQVLLQTAYGALQTFMRTMDANHLMTDNPQVREQAAQVVQSLSSVTDALSATVHDPVLAPINLDTAPTVPAMTQGDARP